MEGEGCALRHDPVPTSPESVSARSGRSGSVHPGAGHPMSHSTNAGLSRIARMSESKEGPGGVGLAWDPGPVFAMSGREWRECSTAAGSPFRGSFAMSPLFWPGPPLCPSLALGVCQRWSRHVSVAASCMDVGPLRVLLFRFGACGFVAGVGHAVAAPPSWAVGVAHVLAHVSSDGVPRVGRSCGTLPSFCDEP